MKYLRLLHAITAAFHEVRDQHRRNKLTVAEEEKAIHQGYNGVGAGHNGLGASHTAAGQNVVGHGGVHNAGAKPTGATAY